MVAASSNAPEIPKLHLPVAEFIGDGRKVALRYNGATTLANFVISSLIEGQPASRVQAMTFLRRGRLVVSSGLRLPDASRLSAELRVTDHGDMTVLSTVNQAGPAQQQGWELTWTRNGDGEMALTEVAANTATTSESIVFPDGQPEFDHVPTELEVAAIGGLPLRAATAMQEYYRQLSMPAAGAVLHVRLGRTE